MDRIKRIADILEKLGVAGVALAIFQDTGHSVGWAIVSLVMSILLTRGKK